MQTDLKTSASPKTLIVFDFDHTIVDDNSDTFFLQKLEPILLENLNKNATKENWTYLIDHNLGLLHERKYSSLQILESLDTIPLEPKMEDTIRLCSEKGHILRVLSDANNLFINRILGTHGLTEKFESVTTNPASIDENDRIHLTRYHKEDHCCTLCPPNLCKGKVLKEWNGFERVFYIGDGWGDLCPILGLNPMDIAFVRSEKTLSKYLNKKEEHQTKAQVIYWKDAEELYQRVHQVLNETINKTFEEKKDHFLAGY